VSCVVPNALEQKENSGKISPVLLAAIDRLLIEGIKVGPISKRRAIKKVLRNFPEITRGDCWQRIRYLRKSPELADLQTRQPQESRTAKADRVRRPSPRPWTPSDDDKLLDWAGYEPVKKIAQRLGRSPRAIRFRLCALGMSAKVTDGWSLRGLQKLLRVSPLRLRQLIGSGKLRVRDARIPASSLATFCDQNRTSLDPSVVEKVMNVLARKRDAYPWERVADLLGVAVTQVQSWISYGQLKVLDPFISDRSFEEFCKKHGAEINTALIDRATAKWLVEEYGVAAPAATCQTVMRAQKHALVVRTCKCGRKIAGNVYFKHVKACKVAAGQAMGKAA
jgi:hypothetical protein